MRFLLVSTFSILIQISFASGWIQKSNFGGDARHRTTGLSLNNKAYMGLGHYNGAGVNILYDDWWEYDPSTNAWTQKADYLGGDCYHAAGFEIDNIGYVGTGRTSAIGSILVQDFFKYDPVTNIWTPIASFAGVGRRGAVSFVLDDIAYVGTGESNVGRVGTFYKYDPQIDTWTQVSSIPSADRTSSVAFSIDNYGYVGTGDLSTGSTNDFWQYDPSLDQWTQKPNVGQLPRQEASAFSLEGKGYILTGLNSFTGDNYSDMWEYDPTTETWLQIGDFLGTSRRYLTSLVLNGNAYAGLGTNGVNFSDFWLWDKYLSLLEDELSQTEIKIYPNPSSDYFKIDLNLSKEVELNHLELDILNLSGQIERTEPILKNNSSYTTSGLSNGKKIFHLRYKDQVLRTGNLIITK